MYQYTEFDRAFVQARANQYRDQLTRWQAGQLPEDEFRGCVARRRAAGY